MNIVGLFSGIGGLELPFQKRGLEATLLCEYWQPAQAVLRNRFPGVEVHGDIATLPDLPSGTELVTAGFPCTDLSQAGRTAGIKGRESGLVAKVFDLLSRSSVECLVLENVRNMLVLDGGRAMAYLTSSLEGLGYRWAYRLVNSQFTGVPQRRHRVILVACRDGDPRRVLFADDCREPDLTGRRYRDNTFGFYWTEGLRGLGWAQDAVPPLKGGSGLGIPSPPAVWIPDNPVGRRIVTPTIEGAERMQGFPAGWTRKAEKAGKRTARWKLVGNAVSTGVGEWVGERLLDPGDVAVDSELMRSVTRWPDAAYGENGDVYRVEASQWPKLKRVTHLMDVLDNHGSSPLSARATDGFLERARRAKLHFKDGFLDALDEHSKAMAMTRIGEVDAVLHVRARKTVTPKLVAEA